LKDWHDLKIIGEITVIYLIFGEKAYSKKRDESFIYLQRTDHSSQNVQK